MPQISEITSVMGKVKSEKIILQQGKLIGPILTIFLAVITLADKATAITRFKKKKYLNDLGRLSRLLVILFSIIFVLLM